MLYRGIPVTSDESLKGRGNHVKKSTPLWKTVWRFLKKLKIELYYNPANAVTGNHTHTHTRAHTHTHAHTSVTSCLRYTNSFPIRGFENNQA